MTQAFEALHATAQSYSSRILCSNLTRRNTWVAYFAVFVPSMTCTLLVLYHSPRKLQKVQSAATRTTLMKIGFNRNTAHRVVYGPSRYGGLGFRNLFVEQGISQVEMLVRDLRAGSSQGTLMRITLSWWQLVVGVSFPLLKQPSHLIPHLEPRWPSTMRHFLDTMNVLLTLPKPLCVKDTYIMDVIISLPSPTSAPSPDAGFASE
jgi:hypothetical protein